MPRVMIVAGEPSGDRHAARLVDKLQHEPIGFFGMGGNAMQLAGVELVETIDKISVMGIFELLGKLPHLYKTLFKLKSILRTREPDLLILVDYQAFNLKLAKTAKKLGVKTLFYIGPQVWAWREYRVQKIKAIVDHMAVIFPFEVDFYQKHGMKATFVGHPLIDGIKYSSDLKTFKDKHHIQSDRKIVAFLPGSRSSEIKQHMPIFREVFFKLAHQDAVEILLSHYNKKSADAFDNLPLSVKVIDSDYYDMIRCADFAVVASGTATLEVALLKTPMVMVVKVSNLSYQIYKRMIKTPFIAIVNIIAGRKIIEELVQSNATPACILNAVNNGLNDISAIEHMQAGFDEIAHKLQAEPDENLADLVLNMLNDP